MLPTCGFETVHLDDVVPNYYNPVRALLGSNMALIAETAPVEQTTHSNQSALLLNYHAPAPSVRADFGGTATRSEMLSEHFKHNPGHGEQWCPEGRLLESICMAGAIFCKGDDEICFPQ